MSLTVTNWAAVDELPLSSVAVQVTVVVPNGKCVGASLVTVIDASQTSLTTGEPRAAGGPMVIVHSKVKSGGAVMWGGVVSLIVTDCVAIDELPLSSVAVQMTMVTPSENFAGALLVTAGVASHTSLTTGEPRETICPDESLHSNVRSGGAVK